MSQEGRPVAVDPGIPLIWPAEPSAPEWENATMGLPTFRAASHYYTVMGTVHG